MKRRNYLPAALMLTLLILIAPGSFAQVGQIIWEEDFSSLNTDIWNYDEGDGCPELCGWGNAELQYYRSQNVSIEEISSEPGNYALVLEAKAENFGGKSFTSGKITTENKLAIKYGMIEVRMKVPDLEVGLWPAAWLLGTNIDATGWPWCGEIDMMEMGQRAAFRAENGFPTATENYITGSNLIFYTEDACTDENPTCAASIAADAYYCTPYNPLLPLNDRFVIYRLYWDENEIQFSVEDRGIVHNMYTGPFPIGDESSEFRKPFYMILNLAVGGNFTDAATDAQVTAPLPGKMYVDYIRLRKWNGKGEITTPDDIMANAGGNIEVLENDTVRLDGSGSYGNIQSYEWTIADTVISTNLTHKLVLPAGTHQVKLTVKDADGNAESDEITVRVGAGGIGEIIWEEQFDSFNADIWNIEVGDGCDQGPNLCGWGNAELEYYHPDNVFIEEIPGESGNNALVLEARRENMGSSAFTSGKVTTENKVAVKYGVIDVRMKVPDLADGLWPAAWFLGTNHNTVGWPRSGEIDMMEMGQSASERERQGYPGVSANRYVGANLLWYTSAACSDGNPTCAASIAYDVNYNKPYVAASPLNERFVIYRLYWDDTELRFTVIDNGTEYDLYEGPFPVSGAEETFKQPFYMIMNLAVGGRFTGILNNDGITAPMPAKMYIDYVRVRKWNGKGEVSVDSGAAGANAGTDQAIVDEDRNGVETVSLDGSNSFGNIVSYEWSENGALIALGEQAEVELSTGNHFITLTATDSAGNVSTDEVKVDIREILWQEDFNSLDAETWNVITGDGCPDNCGWGNAELEFYNTGNVYTEEIGGEAGNSALVLEAKSESMGSKSFTSGKVTTQDKMSIRYGLVETRIRVPDLETGLWPAATMLGINYAEVGWPQSGGIDIMEMGQNAQFRLDKGIENADENNVVGADLVFYEPASCSGENPDCIASISFDNYYCTPYNAATPLNGRFVTYRTYWDDREIRFTVEDNGNEYDLYTAPFPIGSSSSAFLKPFFLNLNLAVGGDFTDAATPGEVTAPLPAKMMVDYVRVLKWNGRGEIDFADGLIANAGADILVVDEDGDRLEEVTLDGSGSTDYDGIITDYMWKSDGELIASEATPTVTFSRGTHKVFLTVTDNDFNTETDSLLVVVRGLGLAPTAVAGNDTTVFDDDGDDLVTFSLDGSGSFDSSDTIIGYSWFEDENLLATGMNPSIVLSTGLHTITLEVMNTDSLTDYDDILVTVIDPDNLAPLADAGPDQTVDDDNGDDLVSISLDGSGSSDSDGTIEDYSWLEHGGEIATGIAPVVDLSTGIHTVILEVTDDDGVSATDTLMLTIIDPDNIPPLADAGNDTLIIDEDLDDVARYEANAAASSDSDGVIEAYRWTEDDAVISEEVVFTTELSTGLHTLVLEVTDDDGVSATDTVLVKVNQLPVAVAGADVILTDTDDSGVEAHTLDGSGSYDPFGTIETFTWTLNETEIGTGVTATHDFAIGTNVVQLEVTDDDGSTSADEVLVVVARTDNNAPTALAGEDITVAEEDADGIVTVQLDASGTEDQDGSIVSYAWLEGDAEIASGVDPMVDFEVGVHTITLVVTDNEGATGTDELTVTILERINLALNKPTVTSSNENGGLAGANAVDGDEGTRWSSSFSDPQWIYVDLEARYDINQVILLWEAAYGSAYQVQVSDNAETWVTIFAEDAGDGELDEILLSGTGRYVRINGTSRGTVYGYSLFEFEVYGTAVEGTNANLSDLAIEGVTVEGFSPAVFTYSDTLESGITEVPDVTADSEDPNAVVYIYPAGSIPGTTTVEVISPDGRTVQTYSIEFVRLLAAGSSLARKILVYPNPVKDHLTIELPGNTTRLSITDISGRMVEQWKDPDPVQRIDMQGYQPGTYLLNVLVDDLPVTVRIIKAGE